MGTLAPARVEDLELSLLVSAVRARWGIRLDHRVRAPLERRVSAFARDAGCATPSELLGRVLREAAWRDRLLDAVGRSDVALFRQAGAWRAFRREVVPLLRTWPRLRLWVPMCGGGEDVWSLAVVLAEEGLYERSWIYATDLAEPTIERARAGRWEGATLDERTALHLGAGGTCPAATWFVQEDGAVAVHPVLRARVSFACHDPCAQAPHNSFHVVVARDVLLHATPEAGARALNVIHGAMLPFAVLLLGRSEELPEGPAGRFEPMDETERIFRRIR